MHGISATDGDRNIDWSTSAAEYANWRPGYPPDFYERLAVLGVGRPGQRILDLGTGTGLVALELARRGARVVGIDVAEGQLEEARRVAQAEGLDAQFHLAPAEETGLESVSFDAVTASQCWVYFDRKRVIPEVRRLLGHGGVLVTCHLCWMPRLDALARAT
jgi:ubiquinone/menaquinone biosynthesis C-methylase UbiE